MTTINFGENFKGGYHTWRKNLILCVPFILGMIIAAVIAMAIMLPVMFSMILPLTEQKITNPTEAFQQFSTMFSDNIITFIALMIIVVVATSLIMAFFTAGAIGMAKEALLTGKATIAHMFEYGKRKYLSLFGANLLVALIIMIGFLALIPGFMAMFSNMQSAISETPNPDFIFGTFTLIVGYLFALPYWLIMSIVLALVPYAVVLDNTKAIGGFKQGIKVFFHHNIMNVFVTWLLIMLIIFASILLVFIPIIGVFIMLLLLILVIIPLVTVWWVKLYLTITKDTPYQSGEPTNIEV
jgi:hypothetical protein